MLQSAGAAVETAELLATVARALDVHTTQPGTWEFYCSVHDHYEAGMRAQIQVSGKAAVAEAPGPAAASAAGPAPAAPGRLALVATALLAAAVVAALAA